MDTYTVDKLTPLFGSHNFSGCWLSLLPDTRRPFDGCQSMHFTSAPWPKKYLKLLASNYMRSEMLVREVLSHKTYNNRRKIPLPWSRSRNGVLGLYPLQQSLAKGSYVKMLVREVLSDKTCNNRRKIPVPCSRNRYVTLDLYSLQQSLVKGSYVKMLLLEILLDRYKITNKNSSTME